jgi:hypothetical protein
MQQHFPGIILNITGDKKDMVETRISFDGIDACFNFYISEFRNFP